MATNCTPCPVCPAPISGVPGSSPLDPDNPFLNLSAEAPDVDLFIGRHYTTGDPPLDTFYYAVGCVGFCLAVTQEEADLCAARQNELCDASNWPISVVNPDFDPSNPTSPPVRRTASARYGNTPQTCTMACAGGTVNSYTVPAGTIISQDVNLSNAQAYSLACIRVERFSICLSALSADRVCFGQPATLTISATSNSPVAFAIAGGSLPTGMTSDNEFDVFTISGTPTVGGNFSFTLEANNTDGTSVTQIFTIEVFGISNSSVLTQAPLGAVYSQALTLTGSPVGVFDYAVVGGALPTGLTLNATSGIISGTPTVAGTYNFTVQVEDQG